MVTAGAADEGRDQKRPSPAAPLFSIDSDHLAASIPQARYGTGSTRAHGMATGNPSSTSFARVALNRSARLIAASASRSSICHSTRLARAGPPSADAMPHFNSALNEAPPGYNSLMAYLLRSLFCQCLFALLGVGVIPAAAACSPFPPFVCTVTSASDFGSLMHGIPTQFIDFETLPNGQPSVGGTQITPSFNYTNLGVTFSAPVGTPIIGGPANDHDLRVQVLFPPTRTWLSADFANPSFGVGIYFDGSTTMTAFDSAGAMIATQSYGASGGPWFIGIYSELPIDYIIVDRGGSTAFINDFIFSPIPEPATLALLALAAAFSRRRP